jgi:hypothetical protein
MQGRINTLTAKAVGAANAVVSVQPTAGNPQGDPGTAQRWRILRVIASLGSASAIAALTITDDRGVALIDVDGNSCGAGNPVPGIFTVSLAAGGAGIVGKVNIVYTLEF